MMSLESFKDDDSDTSEFDSSKRSWSKQDILDIVQSLYKQHGEVTLSMFDDNNSLPSSWTAKNKFDSWSRAKELAGIGDSTIECQDCGKRYKKVSRHWYETECKYPTITDEEKSILVGLMMGDATLTSKHQENPAVRLVNTNKEFVDWTYNKLERIAYPPKLVKTAEESAQLNIDSGFSPNADSEKYNDVYKVNTVSHEDFWKLDWIKSESKTIPENIPLNSIMVNMWYCSDGSLHWRDERNKAEARITNVCDNDNLEKFQRMFSEIGFNVRVGGKEIQFDTQQTDELLNWMGNPPDGMEYKWENNDRSEYESSKK